MAHQKLNMIIPESQYKTKALHRSVYQD